MSTFLLLCVGMAAVGCVVGHGPFGRFRQSLWVLLVVAQWPAGRDAVLPVNRLVVCSARSCHLWSGTVSSKVVVNLAIGNN